MTAPVESVTVPEIAPYPAICALAVKGSAKVRIASHIRACKMTGLRRIHGLVVA
jgi:hypothetical protein